MPRMQPRVQWYSMRSENSELVLENVAASVSDDVDDDSPRDPICSLNNIIRDENSTLTGFEIANEHGELGFGTQRSISRLMSPSETPYTILLSKSMPTQKPSFVVQCSSRPIATLREVAGPLHLERRLQFHS